MAASSDDDWFKPFELLSQAQESINYFGVPNEVIEIHAEQAVESKDEVIERLKGTIKYLQGEIEDRDLYILSVENLRNFSSVNSTTVDATSEEESSSSKNAWNVSNVDSSSQEEVISSHEPMRMIVLN